MLIGSLLTPDHPWHTEAPNAGTLVWEGNPQDLATAARATIGVLLLDAAGLTPVDLDALRAYRIQRPDTRILVSLLPDAVPGDPAIAGLVALGIYDLFQGGSLTEAIGHRATYADAARWLLTVPTSAARSRGRAAGEPRVIERVVERRVPLSQRPVFIVVGGVGAGVGVTSLSVAIATHLAGRGHRAALVETGEPSLSVLADRSGPGPWIPNLDVYPRALGQDHVPLRELLRARRHAYLVADVGVLGSEHLREDADLTLLVLPGDPHRYLRAETWRQSHRDTVDGLRVVVAGGSAPERVAQTWREIAGGDPLVVPVTSASATPGRRGGRSLDLEAALDRLLGDLAPDSGINRRWVWPFSNVRTQSLTRP